MVMGDIIATLAPQQPLSADLVWSAADCARCESCDILVPPGHGISDAEGVDLCAKCGAEWLLSETQEQHRAAMVRLVVAQQWAVAVNALSTSLPNGDIECPSRHLQPVPGFGLEAAWCAAFVIGHRLADLPCAVDVVADLLGAP